MALEHFMQEQLWLESGDFQKVWICGYEIFGEIRENELVQNLWEKWIFVQKLIPAKFRHQSKTQSKFKVQIEFY